jgi:hypothetical protein
MAANRAERYPISARPDGGGFAAPEPEVSFEARPLPSDPTERAEILAMVEEGLADARAGRGVDADEVMARWDAMLAARLQ